MSTSTAPPRPLRSILRLSTTSLTSSHVQEVAATGPNTIPFPTFPSPPLTTQTNDTETTAPNTPREQDDAPPPSSPSPPPFPSLPPPPPPTPTGLRVRFAQEPATVSIRRNTRALRTLKANGFLRPREHQPVREGHRVGAYQWERQGRENEWPRPNNWTVDPTTVRALQDLGSAVVSENWWTWDGCEVDDRTRRGRMMAPEFYSFE